MYGNMMYSESVTSHNLFHDHLRLVGQRSTNDHHSGVDFWYLLSVVDERCLMVFDQFVNARN